MKHPADDIVLPKTVERAVLYAVAYADVFDYPLTAEEIHRYLVGVRASFPAVQVILSEGRLASWNDYYTLPGREAIVEVRLRRAKVATWMWPQAVRYGRAIARLPFVRMVAVTGALAKDNAEPGTDVDYLIVTEPGRLWLSRAMTIALVVRPAARHDATLCPNYLLSERAMAFSPRSLFAAHEVTQMIPLAGLEVYQRLREANAWTVQYLPNARGAPNHPMAVLPSRPRTPRLAEAVLDTPPGNWLEQWEMKRKIQKFSQQHADQGDAAFSADWCKGHFDSHRQAILTKFAQRLHYLE